MTSRILPPEEWSKLAGTLLDGPARTLDPATTQIVVVEHGERIIGCAALWMMPHLDGVWIDPAYRQRISIGRRLRQAVHDLLTTNSIPEVWAMATTVRSRRLIERFGQALHMDCDHFAVTPKAQHVE